MIFFQRGSLQVEAGGLLHDIGRFTVPDGLHIWWGLRGVHIYWRKSDAGRRIIFDRLPEEWLS